MFSSICKFKMKFFILEIWVEKIKTKFLQIWNEGFQIRNASFQVQNKALQIRNDGVNFRTTIRHRQRQSLETSEYKTFHPRDE